MEQRRLPSSFAFQTERLLKDISNQDDRIMALRDYFVNVLGQTNELGKDSQLEIEAKIGKLVYDQTRLRDISHSEDSLIKHLMNQKYWTILVDQARPSGGSYYQFQSGINSATQGRQIFDRLLGKFEHIWQSNKSQVRSQSIVKSKDVFYQKGNESYRASYYFDDNTKEYQSTPYEVITKQRISDMNIKKGTNDFILSQDIRISSNIEKKIHDIDLSMLKVTREREKIRHKYKFQYLVFDLTHTKMFNQRTNLLEEEYEVEVEIEDINYLRGQLQDQNAFYTIILRFFQNVVAVSQLVSECHHELNNGNTQPKINHNNIKQEIEKKEKKLQQYTEESKQSYKQYYGSDTPFPIVGDYLERVAYYKTK